MADSQQTIMDAIRMLLQRKDLDPPVELGSVISELGLESLDLAELSAILEDDLGKDPYSAGILPQTVGELVDWYNT